ncbi:MAG: M1 family metallopeptidase [Myxococcota bacterium]
MVRATAIALWALAFAAAAKAQTEARADGELHAAVPSPASEHTPPARPRYELYARLDPTSHDVHGKVRIEVQAPAAMDVLELHTYLNAFASDETVFMRESGGQLRGDRMAGRGSIELSSLSVRTGGEPIAFERTDEVIENDRTQLRLRLARAVQRNERFVVECAFISHLPPVFARSGHYGDFHMVAQWFPKLAFLREDGSFRTYPYHGHGEFFANFADYHLVVDAPANYDVGATHGRIRTDERGRGALPTAFVRRLAPDEVAGRRHTFYAERVHDAAFAAAPNFVEYEANAAGVALRVLAPIGYEAAARHHLAVTRDGLAYFGEHYGAYPYDSLTVIVPPSGASGAAGMEYPTLFVTAGPPWRMRGAMASMVAVPMALHTHVTIHELGHQWFQGLVASDEVQWPMLDEGITEWVTVDYLQERFGPASAGRFFGLQATAGDIERLLAYARSNPPPPGQPAHAFGRGEYGRSVYAASAAVFETLARTWGRTRMRRAIGAYARTQRFRHPGPDALFAAFDEVYGPWMSVRLLRPALLGGARATFQVSAAKRENGVRVAVRRTHALPLPVRIAFDFDDGTHYAHLAGQQSLQVFDAPADLRAVRVDPDDHNLTGAAPRFESWSRRQDTGPPIEQDGIRIQPPDGTGATDSGSGLRAILSALLQAFGP